MKKLLFSVLSLLMLCIGMKAQTNIANYKFASSAGTYVPLTGGTTLFTTWDSDVSASIPLGGNFTYGAATYTACFISSNGFITFNTAPGTSDYTPLSGGSYLGAISAYAQDGSNSEVLGATPSISYENIGGATGEFVVQFADHANYWGNATERLNFQIRLNLATGAIKIVYGSWTAPGSGGSGITSQIGIRGNSTNWTDNINSLNTLDVPVGTTCTWANPVNSDSNGSTMLFSTGNALITPSNGLTYTWAPPVNATLAPVRLFTAVTGTTTTSATINWTAPTGATQYNVQYRIPGTCSWTNFSGNPVAATTATLTGLTSGTIYQVRVQSNDGSNNAIWSHIPNSVGSGSGYSASGTFSTLPTCPAISGLNTSTITGMAATFTWTPGGSEGAWDIYYGTSPLTAPTASTVPTATSAVASYSATGLTSATNYTVYVRANCGSADMSAWSAAKTFSTVTTCTVPTSLNTSTITGSTATFTWVAGAGSAWDLYYGPTPLTAPSITTAPTATSSTNSYTATGLNSGSPYSVYVRNNCGGGDVSNWSLVKNFTTVITCTVPTALTISNITNASATFSWTSVATAFDVYYGSATTVPNATTIPTATTATNFYPATSLTPATAYSVYVRANCGAGDVSTWTAVKAFTTLCNPYTTFPYTESFSATFPACWSVSEGATGASYHWEPSLADAAHGVAGPKAGTNFMRLNVFNASTTYNTYKLNTPPFSLGTTVRQIKYNYFIGNSGYKGTTGATGADPYPLSLQVSTDLGATWIALYNHTSGNSTLATTSSTVNWQSNAVILSAYVNQNAIFRFVSNSNFGSATCNQAIDEFIIEDAPACLPTSNVTMSSLTPTSAVATWTMGGIETAWDVYYGPTPLTVPTATTVPTTTTSVTNYTLNSLTPSTGYDVYVRANCGGSVSPWTNVSTFMTPCLPPNVVSTIGGTRCGIGTTTLNATGDPGATLQWYANPTGGVAIGTGTLFTTPTITNTTNYYVTATGGLTNVSVGPLSPTAEGGTISSSSVDWEMNFDVLQNTTLASVDIFPTAAIGAVGIIKITTSTGTLINNISYTTTVTGGNMQTITLNVPLTPGTGYIIRQGASVVTLNRNTTAAAYPYTSSAINITGNGFDQNYYYYFYNWKVTSGCESARTMVTATVTAPAALTLNSAAAICAGSGVATLSVTSTLSDYDSYAWTPTTGLFSDAAATVPYTGTASTVYVNTVNDGILNYNVTANNSVSGCATVASTSVQIKPSPTSITLTANPNPICAGNTVSLSVSANNPPLTVLLNENFNGASNSWTAVNSSTGGTPANAAWTLRNSPYNGSNVGSGITSNDASQFYLTDSDAQGSGGTANTTLQSPVINTTGLSTLNLSFYHYYNYFNSSDVAKVEVSTNGTTWTSVQDYATGAADIGSATAFNAATINLNAYVGNATLYIRYNYSASYGYGWAIDNVELKGVSINDYNYAWTSNPAGFTGSTASITDVPTANTTYSVVITNTATSCSNSSSVAVVVNTVIPTVTASSSSASVCAGSSATLTAGGATNYTWTPAGTTSTITVTPSTATVYTVTGETSGCSNTATVSVGVNAVPSVTATATKTLVCVNFGESSLLSWTDGVNTMTTSVTPTVGTTYTLVINDGTCNGSTTIFVDAQICSGINSLVNSGAINIFPNPTNGILNIAITAELAGSTSIEVYDAIGKLVIKEALSNETTTINTSKLTDGMYFYKVINNNKAINIGKIVKH